MFRIAIHQYLTSIKGQQDQGEQKVKCYRVNQRMMTKDHRQVEVGQVKKISSHKVAAEAGKAVVYQVLHHLFLLSSDVSESSACKRQAEK